MRLSSTVIDQEIQNTISNNLKDRVIWDDSIKGFGTRIRPGGGAYFVAVYRFQGQLKKLTIGRYGRITLAQARDEARLIYGEVTRGMDPASKKRESRAGLFMKDLCRIYVDKVVPKKRSGYDEVLRINRYILPKLGSRKVSSITYVDIVAFHEGIKAPVQANRCLSLLSKMFSFAKEIGHLDRALPNPTEGVKKNPERERTRFVRDDEMPRLLGAIQSLPDFHIRSALLIYLFTGIRQSSVIVLKWSDLDLDAALLFERGAKTAKEGEVITHALGEAAVATFREIPKFERDDSVFLCGRGIRTRINDLRKAWDKVKADAGINEAEDKLWLHDLRRTLGTWMASKNYSPKIVQGALKHKTERASKRYQHIKNEGIVRDAINEATKEMLASVNTVQTSAG